MTRVAVTQRVTVVPSYGERRDSLDQNWSRFLRACGLSPVLLPNIPELALAMCSEQGISGIVLTGGNDLAVLGGDAPERDATETALVAMAEASPIPILGVCRGMQVLQHHYGIPLQRVEGHVTSRQTIQVCGRSKEVNSYHRFGALETRAPLEIWASAGDGVVKAVRHMKAPVMGIMWHPERMDPFSTSDINLFREFFEGEV